jgi:hypothetical protein
MVVIREPEQLVKGTLVVMVMTVSLTQPVAVAV